ncbi:MAG TPA: branched-chain amino acid ABC transporter permease [Acetobacteraceae bacterium]|nr:branched-chain amino acid ABC transporter permease [Acetobacteraceae bacterium]
MTLYLVQALNGLQLGVLLFLIAAGLTLVFGVMDLINLAHGVQYMLGAYLAVLGLAWTGSFWLALVVALAGSFAAGLVLDALVFRRLLTRDHLDQVLATYGLILIFEEGARTLFGAAPRSLPIPDALEGTVALAGGLNYPVYRLALLAGGLGVAALLWLVIERTRAGMLVRAGASNAPILDAMGVDVRRLFTMVIAVGAMLAGFAGAVAAPLIAVEPGMGGSVLILAFVVIVVGGVGSIRGAFVAALLVGLTDALGRTLITDALRQVLNPSAARMAGPALASMTIYLLMAGVLGFMPRGLLPARGRA